MIKPINAIVINHKKIPHFKGRAEIIERVPWDIVTVSKMVHDVPGQSPYQALWDVLNSIVIKEGDLSKNLPPLWEKRGVVEQACENGKASATSLQEQLRPLFRAFGFINDEGNFDSKTFILRRMALRKGSGKIDDDFRRQATSVFLEGDCDLQNPQFREVFLEKVQNPRLTISALFAYIKTSVIKGLTCGNSCILENSTVMGEVTTEGIGVIGKSGVNGNLKTRYFTDGTKTHLDVGKGLKHNGELCINGTVTIGQDLGTIILRTGDSSEVWVKRNIDAGGAYLSGKVNVDGNITATGNKPGIAILNPDGVVVRGKVTAPHISYGEEDSIRAAAGFGNFNEGPPKS